MILSGIVIAKVSNKIKFFLVLSTIPTALITLKNVYIPSRPPAILPIEEVEALNFLKSQPDGVVLTYPFERDIQESKTPLYKYESTAYVSAFSGKTTYLEDEVNLDITGYNWPERRKNLKEFYSSLNHKLVWNFLRENNITYVYWLKGQRATLGETQLGIERIFENEMVYVYKVI